MNCRVVPYRILSCLTVPYRAVPCHTLPCRAVSCRAMSYRAVPGGDHYGAVSSTQNHCSSSHNAWTRHGDGHGDGTTHPHSELHTDIRNLLYWCWTSQMYLSITINSNNNCMGTTSGLVTFYISMYYSVGVQITDSFHDLSGISSGQTLI